MTHVSSSASAGPSSTLSHVDAKGQAHMVDVGHKPSTRREARAAGVIRMLADTLVQIEANQMGKGDVLACARIAGIMAAKRASELVPLCHPLMLGKVSMELSLDPSLPGVRAEATVVTAGQTGVEIEALCAVQVALLTIYDMCKAVDRGMTITEVRLLEKSGGASGHFIHPGP